MSSQKPRPLDFSQTHLKDWTVEELQQLKFLVVEMWSWLPGKAKTVPQVLLTCLHRHCGHNLTAQSKNRHHRDLPGSIPKISRRVRIKIKKEWLDKQSANRANKQCPQVFTHFSFIYRKANSWVNVCWCSAYSIQCPSIYIRACNAFLVLVILLFSI